MSPAARPSTRADTGGRAPDRWPAGTRDVLEIHAAQPRLAVLDQDAVRRGRGRAGEGLDQNAKRVRHHLAPRDKAVDGASETVDVRGEARR
jgi:hypothetical protein